MQSHAFLSVFIIMCSLKLLSCENTFTHWLQFYISFLHWLQYYICSSVSFLCVSSNSFLGKIVSYIDCNGMPFLLYVFYMFLKTAILQESFFTLIAMLYFLTLMVFMCSLKLLACEDPFSYLFYHMNWFSCVPYIRQFLNW